MLHSVFVFCLSVGAIYSAFSLIFHFCSLAFDIGFDADLGLETHFDIFLPIKPFTIMVFLTVFGGAGLIAEKSAPGVIAVPIAATAAYAIALLLYKSVYLNLLKAQTETKSIKGAIGMEATILESIPKDGFGRISYVVDSNILSGVAKRLPDDISDDRVLQNNDGRTTVLIDSKYKKGSKVFILDAKDNIYYVAPKVPERKEDEVTRQIAID